MSRNDKTMFRQTGTQDKTRQKSFGFCDKKNESQRPNAIIFDNCLINDT